MTSDAGIPSHAVFQDPNLPFSHGRNPDHPAVIFPDSRERYIHAPPEFRPLAGNREGHDWNEEEEDDEEENEDDDDDDEEEDDDDGDVEGLVNVKEGRESVGLDDGSRRSNYNNSSFLRNNSKHNHSNANNNNSSGSVQNSPEKNGERNLDRENGGHQRNLDKIHASFGLNGGRLVKDIGLLSTSTTRGDMNECQSSRIGVECSSNCFDNAMAAAEPDNYYPQIIRVLGPSVLQKEIGGDNGCGFSGRKENISIEAGDSLRASLSDPFTGALMDDAMILTCGHSFGRGGIEQVLRMQACYTCGQAMSRDSMAPNHTLRAAVKAFRREEDLHLSRASKRRRDRYEQMQDKGNFGDIVSLDGFRTRGVQFPFAVNDRVVIKGNKRTPQRFVGREAIVTTQCLNGWYVVKTLDNSESVKLQYRSLFKAGENPPMNGIPQAVPQAWVQ